MANIEEDLTFEDLSAEVVETGDEIEVTFSDPAIGVEDEPPVDVPFSANLAEYYDPDELAWLGEQVVESTEADLMGRKEWEDQLVKGLESMGLRIEETNEPFPGACTASHPLIIENALKFQSKAIAELFPPNGPVKTQILGPITDESRDRANKVQLYMNWQATKQMPEYFEEKERLLLWTALVGNGFTKTYWDSNLMRPMVEHVPITDFVVPIDAKDLRTTPRMTHILYYRETQMRDAVRTGFYLDADIGEPDRFEPSELKDKMNSIQGLKGGWQEDTGYTLYEQQLYIQLEKFGDDYEKPYIVTVDKGTKMVLSIRRGWEESDPTEQRRNYFTHYKFTPGLNFYGLGLISLLGNLSKTINASLRSLVDSGQFANMQGGFKAKGVRVTNDDPIGPGTWKEVEATGMDLSKALYPLPYKEPSNTLKALLELMVGAAQKFADSTDQVVADSTNYGPVGTTLALLDASSKFYSAIHKRLHKSQGDELVLLADLNRKYLPASGVPFGAPGSEIVVTPTDFTSEISVVPVSDPNISSQAHRVAINTMLYQVAKEQPGILDVGEVIRRTLLDMNIPEPDKLLAKQPSPQPLDPISDIMAAVKGGPIAAFPEQDHDSHIAIKTAWLQDPLNGANPVMEGVSKAIQANVKEHMVLKYKAQMDGLMAMQLDAMQAAALVLRANEIEEVNDVEVKKIELKTQELDIKRKKTAADILRDAAAESNRSRELDIRERELGQKAELEQKKLNMDAVGMLVDTADKAMNHGQKERDREVKVHTASKANKKPQE